VRFAVNQAAGDDEVHSARHKEGIPVVLSQEYLAMGRFVRSHSNFHLPKP
jgi:hypothetical protein